MQKTCWRRRLALLLPQGCCTKRAMWMGHVTVHTMQCSMPRAALIASGAPVMPEVAKTHSGLITAFSLHLVKAGRVRIELGKALNKVAEIRLIADYTGDEVSPEMAQWAVEQAEGFVEAMQNDFP